MDFTALSSLRGLLIYVGDRDYRNLRFRGGRESNKFTYVHS